MTVVSWLARASRARVLDLFDPAVTVPIQMPWLLLTTDVSAEGLNLQRLGRVVHYDLPWTPAKLGQREGRIIRPGSLSVNELRFQTVSLRRECQTTAARRAFGLKMAHFKSFT